MALLFSDGMDNWDTLANVVTGVWTTSNGPGSGGTFTKSTSSGRFGGGGIAFGVNSANTANGADLDKVLPSTYGTLIVSFAVNFGANTVDSEFLIFRRGGVSQVDFVRTPTTGTIRTYRTRDQGPSIAGTQLGASVAGVSSGAWHWVSIKVKFDSAAGTVDVVVDGVNILSLTGQNTSPVAGNLADEFDISLRGGSSIGAIAHIFDDVICNDTSGAGMTDLLVDRRIYSQIPTGAGVNTQWAPLAGTNFSQVNELPGEDGDTSYNVDSVVGHIDDFAHGTLPLSITSIDAVVLKTYTRKDDAGARSVIPLLLSAGTEGDGATHSLTTSYQGFVDVFLIDPKTGLAWTQAGWNAATMGYKVG